MGKKQLPVYDVPIWTRPFIVMCGLGGLRCCSSQYRELAGLGPSERHERRVRLGNLEDFQHHDADRTRVRSIRHRNRCVAVQEERPAIVMRTACLTSFLAYLSGLAS